jgi:putative glutamine amidotransferase
VVKRAGLTYRFEEKAVPYVMVLEQAGFEVVRITPEKPHGLEGLDALVLSGGTDIEPARFGQLAHPQTGEPDVERDELEAGLLREAIEADLPVLCICRGMQMLNVVLGGDLNQHVQDHPRTKGYDEDVHEVTVHAATKLAEVLGCERKQVNSRHHQAVKRLGEGLRVTALAADGVVEGIELAEARFVVGVQWHPEDRVARDGADASLFSSLLRACR